jgi:Protein of unknown function (DUF3160)
MGLSRLPISDCGLVLMLPLAVLCAAPRVVVAQVGASRPAPIAAPAAPVDASLVILQEQLVAQSAALVLAERRFASEKESALLTRLTQRDSALRASQVQATSTAATLRRIENERYALARQRPQLVEQLAKRDRGFATEVAAYRTAVSGIASESPEKRAALQRYADGDRRRRRRNERSRARIAASNPRGVSDLCQRVPRRRRSRCQKCGPKCPMLAGTTVAWLGSMAIRTVVGCLAVVLAAGCGSSSPVAGSAGNGQGAAASDGGGPGSSAGNGGGSNPSNSGLNPAQQQTLDQLSQQLTVAHSLDAVGLLEKHAVSEAQSLSYDPRSSELLDRIQASALALDDDELAHLGSNGFVISTRSAFPTFVLGYAAIYSEHLPVYISADAILEAVHSSYDAVLKLSEEGALVPTVTQMLNSMHARLPSVAAQKPASAADLDLYLTLARSLLAGTEVAPVAGADPGTVHTLYQLALQAAGQSTVTLFGAEREFDASQFKPRGHYANSTTLSAYFRAMIWLGRTDFRLIETNGDGSQQFLRPQYDAMLLLRQTMSDQELSQFQKVDAALQAFTGESDTMTVPQVDSLLADLGGLDAARGAGDATVEAKLRAGGYGIQRIASQIMANDGVVATLPLARSFALFGQHYLLDSHVFSQVVYDRIPSARMMPNPLDVAFAALGNDQALPLLDTELGKFAGYPGALQGARVLSDAHEPEFWSGNLYNLWLSSLRALSPGADVSHPASQGMPEVTGTAAWGRRILNTQLGSWAELRHDTLLYAKQSYTGVPACDYPDAYVDPYPEFYAKLRLFAERGVTLADLLQSTLDVGDGRLQSYFSNLASLLTTLEGMAKNQREGTPFSAAQLAFVNRAVRIVQEDVTCTTIDAPDGWLADLYFEPMVSITASPTIADVHTQPADEAGNTVGKVLHVATGYPRLMITTVDTCQGPRAYAGVTFAYHEQVTKDYQRLSDGEWSNELAAGTPPADVPWMAPAIAR